MRILFCDNACPGRFGPLPVKLASGGAHEVMFLSFYPRDSEQTPGVVHARLRLDRAGPEQEGDPFLAAWGRVFRLGRQAFRTFCRIRDSGFVPDVVCVTYFDGPAFFLREAFPDAFVVSYAGALHGGGGDAGRAARLRAFQEVQKYQLVQSDMCFVRSRAQRDAFPALLRPRIHVQPPYVDTRFFSPGHGDLRAFFPRAGVEEMVAFHLKGAHRPEEWGQVVLGLLMRRPRCAASLAFGANPLRGVWEERVRVLPEALRARLFLVPGLEREAYRDFLCLSSAHVFPEYAPLQEMLETMSCGSLLLMPAPDGDDEIFRPGETMMAFPRRRAEEQIAALCDVLERRESLASLCARGRAEVGARCGAAALERHWAFIMEEYAKSRAFPPLS